MSRRYTRTYSSGSSKSESGWQGVPKEKRVCHGCGEKLTLNERGGLVLQGGSGRCWHAQCYIDAGCPVGL